MKKRIFLVAAFATSFLSCTTDSEMERDSSFYYNEKVRELAISYGWEYECTSPTPMTKEGYEKMVEGMNLVKSLGVEYAKIVIPGDSVE